MTLPKKLYHYTHRKIPSLRHKKYTYRIGREMIKPVGLWFSVEDFKNEDEDEDSDITWEDFCIDNDFRVNGLRYKYALVLVPSAIILHLDTPEDLDHFHKKYGISSWEINWNQVARKHQGIIIAPYIFERRMCPNAVWYYGWDCASGCIWDTQCIQSFSLLKKRKIIRKKDYFGNYVLQKNKALKD